MEVSKFPPISKYPPLNLCNPTMICDVVPINVRPPFGGLEGDPGTCIPSPGAVLGCFGKLANPTCACPIFTTPDCRYQLSIIDVYIENKTDQRLHLSSCTLLPAPPLFSKKGGNPILVSKWVINPNSNGIVGPPPNIIEIGDIAFMRAVVSCFQECCELETTFSIHLEYTIGVKAKNLGLVSVTVARTKQPTKGKCKFECGQGGLDAVWLKKGFEPLTKTGPSITPITQVYGVSGNITSSQFVMKVVGGNVVNGGGCTGTGRGSCEIDQLCLNGVCMKGCTGDSGCPSGQVCSNNVCVSSTDGLPTKKLLIIITVSVTAFVLVIGFLYFLISISKSRKKTS